MQKTDIRILEKEQLEAWMTSIGQPSFRAKQLHQALAQGAMSLQALHTLPKALRERLAQDFVLPAVQVHTRLDSAKDDTKKYLLRLDDGLLVEAVLMHYRHGYSLCLSTQAGCKMGCAFCASGRNGLERNLLPSEMLGQVSAIEQDSAVRISTIVLMGTGEPLDNLDYVLRFLRWLHDPAGRNLGYRHMTLSTCGLVPEIYALASSGLPINLAVSLHAVNQNQREQIMPIAKHYRLPELLESCRAYFKQTGRRVTFEFALLQGVNDSLQTAQALAMLLKNLHAHVNLIPVNTFTGSRFEKPKEREVTAFLKILEKNGINATVRREMGADIQGACGQLRLGQESFQ